MTTVGVRELRQNASALLDQVAQTGESIEITNHGRPVAKLVPIGPASSSRDEMIAAGLLKPGLGDPLSILPMPAPPGSKTTDEILAELRAE